MAKKLFLNRERAIPTAQVPSLTKEEPDSEVASSSSRNSPVLVRSGQLTFSILDETFKSFQKFNATGRSMLSLNHRAKGTNQQLT
jgi:hypothetical protein